MSKKNLPEELRTLVRISVACLGQVIEKELGRDAYRRIESIRKRMASTREASGKQTELELRKTFEELRKLKKNERLDFAVAYTLMLELMNTCENAYRSFRLQERKEPREEMSPVPVTYVLTAHPTESRSSKNIAIFYEIQKLLTCALEQGGLLDEKSLKSLLAIAWRVPIVRSRKPSVEDEAEHIYSVALRPENLETILRLSRTEVKIYLRSWVGGDKDGHPGVDEKALQNSLQASRNYLQAYAKCLLEKAGDLIDLFQAEELTKERVRLKDSLSDLRKIKAGDGSRIRKLHQQVLQFKASYEKQVGEVPEAILNLEQLLHTFPGLVIPLELREDSGLIMDAKAHPKKKLAIERMIRKVAELSKGGSPRWYSEGFIISMCQSIDHIEAAADLLVRNLGGLKIRVIPLFEQKDALVSSTEIMSEVLRRPRFKAALKADWLNRVEVMLGYSDSSKEAGVLPSRLEVATAMRRLDELCKKAKVQPVFFHGSGGSVDRGGGPVEDQLASWSEGALAFYKATIQGEMVERSFASPAIAESQFKKISFTAISLKNKSKICHRSNVMREFSSLIEAKYKGSIGSESFMQMVEEATPYRFLTALKIGSRPAKRASAKKGSLAVSSLRAIPWILCWTQTRVL
ncbi:MAG: phosphoenolpyruvate carboxylase, partial [Bdellovibrionales bacterium]|nr:phosphoenolpyruvate carboxylase [Oligoflexia bacterium]